MKKGSVLIALLVAAIATVANAGTMPLSWTAVQDSDLAGYRVCWGPTSGSYPTCTDVGPVTTYTLTGLPDCKDSFVCVRARDAAGQVSATCSEIKGWPSIDIATGPKRVFEAGGQYAVTVAGNNFKPGPLVFLQIPGSADVKATGVTLQGCTSMSFTLAPPVNSPIGDWSLYVENTDATWRSLPAFAATVANAPPTPVTGVKRTDQKTQ